MGLRERIKEGRLILDGGMGTLLQERGLRPGEFPEEWNLSHPEEITAIHRAYFEAGADVVSANTFGATLLRYGAEQLDLVIAAAIRNARRAAEGLGEKYVALDIGASGKLLAPLGDFDFEEAVALFAETVKCGVRHGADLIVIETMNDTYETKAALLAAKENSSLPVFVTAAFGEDGKMMTGASPAAFCAMAEGLGADAVGANCSLGPRALSGVMEEFLTSASVPVIFKPNAGLPHSEGGRTVFDVGPEEFAGDVALMLSRGVRLAGGCCGTTPEYIAALTRASRDIPVTELLPNNKTVISSYTHTVTFGDAPILIGERINPTGKKRLKAAILEGDMAYLLEEGLKQEERGAEVLDVNVGVPGIDEAAVLCRAVEELQAVTDLPLQIDTADPVAMERALRRYNGKALVNSVTGKEESLCTVLPLVKKYGGVVVALTLDEEGIPQTARGRLAIARRILSRAEEYGIEKKDVIFDPLAMTVSADPGAARVTLEALALIRSELGCHTSLGVSNVSFGLPRRDLINGTFFAMALEKGLSAAIMNPHSAEMRKVYHAHLALSGKDTNFEKYIAFAETVEEASVAAAAPKTETAAGSDLFRAVVKGIKAEAARAAEGRIAEMGPLATVERDIIPALDEVGRGFEEKRVYLPQLLMSAEAAKAAFEAVKTAMQKEQKTPAGMPVVLATVKGDIHDIGKNIVKLLLENYGFRVTDLGRDVPPEQVLAAAKETGAPLVGLSALMTTTVPAMEETVALLHRALPHVRVMVGGAVLTAEYARAIGADFYAKDAMESVRFAEEMKKKL